MILLRNRRFFKTGIGAIPENAALCVKTHVCKEEKIKVDS